MKKGVLIILLPAMDGCLLAACGIVVSQEPLKFFALYIPFMLVCAYAAFKR